MNCEWAHTTVHGYFDGELDAVRAAEFEHHMQGCAECQASLEQMESLRARLRQSDLYERASSRLRERVHSQMALPENPGPSPALFRRPWFLPSVFALAAAAAFAIALFLFQSHARTIRIAAAVIDAHVRSLQPGHLTDVQSTDQHTVKPWFDGKLDFAPPVSDYSAQGFPLVGGRLDVIDGRNAAAMVYARRKHFINLFVWPAQGAEPLASSSGSGQGYNWIQWHAGDMQFCLVSDVSPPELEELKNLISK